MKEFGSVASLIEQTEVGDVVKVSGWISEFKVGKKKNGEKYSSFKLKDKSGIISVKNWDDMADTWEQTINSGRNYLEAVTYTVNSYNDVLEIHVNNMVPDHFKTKDDSDLYGREYVDMEKLDSDFKYIMGKIKDPCLKALTRECFAILKEKTDNYLYGDTFSFKKSSGSPFFTHHNFAYGLLRHTLDVCYTAEFLLENNRYMLDQLEIDESLVYAGAMLHDIGKPISYKKDGSGGYDRTFADHMLKHTVIGMLLLHDAIERVKKKMGEDFTISNEKLIMLQHIILSHNGKKEWGSPVEPIFVEAFLVHQADYANGSVGTFISGLDGIQLPKEFEMMSEFHKIMRKKYFLCRNKEKK